MSELMKNENLSWKVHVHNLFQEIVENNPTIGVTIRVPLNITLGILKEVAERAIELNDLEMNKLMIRLSLYSISDPNDEDYNPELVSKILGE